MTAWSATTSRPRTTWPRSPASTTSSSALFDGRVGYRSLRATPPEAADNPRGVDVVGLDPVELTLVFGQIAPVRRRRARTPA